MLLSGLIGLMLAAAGSITTPHNASAVVDLAPAEVVPASARGHGLRAADRLRALDTMGGATKANDRLTAQRSVAREAELTPIAPWQFAHLDQDGLLLEDLALGEIPERIGVNRELQLSFDQLPIASRVTEAGRRWLIADIQSPGAQGMRLEFTALDLPAGVLLWVAGNNEREFESGEAAGTTLRVDGGARDGWVVRGPYQRRGPLDSGQFWAGLTPGDVTRVILDVPADFDGTIPAIEFGQISHIYRGLQRGVAGSTRADFDLGTVESRAAQSGTCQVDINCAEGDPYRPLHNATARVIWTGSSSTRRCSGVLLATTLQDETPILLTGEHCVWTQSQANLLNIDWFLQTETCNGAPAQSFLSEIATVLQTSPLFPQGLDMSLLRIEGTIPDGVFFSGWSNSVTTPIGTSVAAIHHPNFGDKKISLGTLTSHPFGNPQDYWGVSWSVGAIEPGSSGGGLYAGDPPQLIAVGSHTATPANCTNADGPSGYGKFGLFAPLTGVNLVLGLDDMLEPNSSCTATRALSDGTYNDLVLKRVDEDFYALVVDTGATLTVSLEHTAAFGNIGLILQSADACGLGALASDLSGLDLKQISYTNSSGTAQQVILQTLLLEDTRNEYDMTVAGSCTPPDAPTNLVATGSCDEVALNWQAAAGATSYVVLRSETADFQSSVTLGTTASTSFDDQTAVAGVTYFYEVRSENCAIGDVSSDVAAAARENCLLIGDLNCDGAVNTTDIEAFVLALLDPTDYASTYPDCDVNAADINGDNAVNTSDIDGFVDLLLS